MAKNDYKIGDATQKAPQRGPGGHGGRGGRVAEKPKNFKKAIKQLLVYLKPYWPLMIVALVLAAAGTVLNVIGPDKIREIMSLIETGVKSGSGIDLKAVASVGIMLVCFYTFGMLFSAVQGFIMSTVTQRTSKSMRRDLTKKINKLPLKYFDSHSYGDVMSRVTNDVDTIGQTLNSSISTMLTAAIMFLGSMIMMFVTNWILALSAIGATLIGFALMALITAKSQKYFVAQQRELGELNGQIEEMYAGHNVVKAYNGEKQAVKEFNRVNKKLRSSAWRSQFMSGMMQPLMSFVGNLGYVVVCVVGAVLVARDLTSIGVIAAFMIYVRLFTQPLTQFAQAITNMQSAAAAGERVFNFLNEPEMGDESQKTARLTEVKGDVSFKNVRFGYDEDKIIIKNFTAEVKAGQKIAIVGPTGAGKTTLVNLLMRFYEINEGSIEIDGTPISELTRENMHDLFSMVLQDTWLFEGSIRDNITFSKKEVSDEELVSACKAAGVDHFIRTLPQGYDTVLNDNANISTGQRQLMTIARAMVENAPMLILDEATSSVDTRTETLIQDAMDRLTEGRTSFVIAHRLSTIKNADLILVLKDGDIIESGNHNDLLTKNGFYAELYNSQFETAA